jgi:hypothetical protein
MEAPVLIATGLPFVLAAVCVADNDQQDGETTHAVQAAEVSPTQEQQEQLNDGRSR